MANNVTSNVGWAKKELERNRQEILTWPVWLRPMHLRNMATWKLEDLLAATTYHQKQIEIIQHEIELRKD